MRAWLFLVLWLLVPAGTALGVTHYVAPTGNDQAAGSAQAPWRTISHGVAQLQPGDTLLVKSGEYREQVTIKASGTEDAPLTVAACPGDFPVIDGTGIEVTNDAPALVLIPGSSHIVLRGFELRNLTTATRWRTPVGILVSGAAGNVSIEDCVLHDIGSFAPVDGELSGRDAHGILVAGDAATALQDVAVTGCELYDLTLGSSEALAINGNVDGFVVSGNTVRDLDNIGIDAIGHEGTAPAGAPDYARNGVISRNTVYNVTSLNNPAYAGERAAGGIYVDGGSQILVERNTVHHCDIGVEIASEHQGQSTSAVIVRSNFIYLNYIAGIAMGGYDTQRGATQDCDVIHNTLFHNDTDQDGNGELLIQYDATGNTVKNNILFAGPQGVLLGNPFAENTGNVFDSNIYYTAGAPEWQWEQQYYTSLPAFQSATGQDAGSRFTDPRLRDVSLPDLHIAPASPARNAAELLAERGARDIDGRSRVLGPAPDIGAAELPVSGAGGLLLLVR